MLSKLRPRSIYDVMAAIACFGVLAGGTAYAANTISSSDIIDGQVNSADVKDQSLTTFDVSTFLGADIVDGSLTGADIADGSLKGADVGQGQFVNFAANVGTIPPQSCVYHDITGINAQGDHMLLTPSFHDSQDVLYAVQYHTDAEYATLQACNPGAFQVMDGITHFNLLVFDAQ